MKSDKYISTRPNVNGFSFANLGLFTGFGDGVISSVYALILLDIFKSAEMVGIYSAVYFAFGLIVQIMFGETIRFFSKAKLFYSGLLAVVICYFMLSFSIKPATFVALDFFTEIPLVFIGSLIPLFMADFSGREGMAKMNGRYHTWLNAGALFAPMIAMAIATNFGNRSAFFASGIIYMLGLFVFKRYRIVQEDKKIPKLAPHRTMKSVLRGMKAFFSYPDLRRAYFVNFGYNAMKAMRLLYMPIAVVQAGYSKDILGFVLTLGILPYVLLSEPIGALAKKFGRKGTKWGLVIGFLTFSIASTVLFFSKNYTMLAIFVLWQIFGAIQEALHDMLFFDVVKKSDRARFFGIFTTSNNFPKVVTPLIGSAAIFLFGSTEIVWVATAIIGIITTFTLLLRPKTSIMKKRK